VQPVPMRAAASVGCVCMVGTLGVIEIGRLLVCFNTIKEKGNKVAILVTGDETATELHLKTILLPSYLLSAFWRPQ